MNEFEALLRKIDGLVSLTTIETISALRQSLQAFSTGTVLDDVEKAHLENALASINALVYRFSQRKIRQAHTLHPSRVEALAEEEGLTTTLQDATSAPVYLPTQDPNKKH